MRLVTPDDPSIAKLTMDVAPYLRTHSMGRITEIHERLASTNDRATALAKAGGVHGLAVVAFEQTKGKGQRGRHWHSPAGAGLYVSFLLRPKLSPRLAPVLPIIAGVATREVLERRTGAPVGLKWPNDLLASSDAYYGRKVAGILVEASADHIRIDHAIVGVGINLRATERPADLAEAAVSVEELTKERPDPAHLLGSLAGTLERYLDEAERSGLASICDAFNTHALGLGTEVMVTSEEEQVHGELLGIAENGALRVQTGAGLRELYRGQLRLSGVPTATPYQVGAE